MTLMEKYLQEKLTLPGTVYTTKVPVSTTTNGAGAVSRVEGVANKREQVECFVPREKKINGIKGNRNVL